MPLTVAVAQPACEPKDVIANARTHAAAIRAARVRLVVFPELSLTGAPARRRRGRPDEPRRHRRRLCRDAVDRAGRRARRRRSHRDPPRRRSGAEVVYRKSFLGGDELTRFTPGPGPVALDVDGWRVGLGICKDTGVAQHVADTAALNVDVYVAGLVHHDHELQEQEARAVRIARACDSYVAFASFAGPTGGGYDRTAGNSAIYSADGRALARTNGDVGRIVRFALT